MDLQAGHDVDHRMDPRGSPACYRGPSKPAGGSEPARISGSQPARVSGSHKSCEGVSQVTIADDCFLGRDAQEAWLRAAGRAGVTITRDHIVDMMIEQLRRFSRGGRFQTLTRDNATQGVLRRSQLAPDIRRELMSAGIIYEHTISGVGVNEGLAVAREAMTEVQHFLDNRTPGARLNEVLKRLEASWCK